MTDRTKKKQTSEKTDINPIVAGVTGAVIGAGVAIAGAALLGDEKKRIKAKKILSNVRDGAVNYVRDLENQIRAQEGVVEEKLAKSAKKVKLISGAAESSLQKKAEIAKKASNK